MQTSGAIHASSPGVTPMQQQSDDIYPQIDQCSSPDSPYRASKTGAQPLESIIFSHHTLSGFDVSLLFLEKRSDLLLTS